MCSIFGVLDIKTDAGELRKKALELSRLMRHRGPDWSGVYASDKAILAHERLSIVDVNAGAQPLYNAEKTHALAVNGEIYNHQALRAEYGDRYQFQTGSDCEVILALYQEKGPEFLDDLQGMFAFALYDSEKDAYLIGRDHIGIIPLYMGHDEHGNFYVASEMKALVPVCRTIKEFPAGSYLWSKDGEIRQYYQRDWFDYDAVKDNVTDKNELRQALEESVKSHLMSDVPYGVLLSGGEMQRLMLARALYKNAPILLLDEPTAALDPIAENDIYQKYAAMTVGRTSVFISHRLASTRFCDRILLIDGGAIAEQGSHEALLAQNGEYASLWRTQNGKA